MGVKQKIILIAAGLLIAVMPGWYFLGKRHADESGAGQPPSARVGGTSGAPALGNPIAEIRRKSSDPATQMKLLYLTPITFYGKVVDQHGDPVPQADVKTEVADHPFGGSRLPARQTDAAGRFSITGIHGISLSIRVSKKGYNGMPAKAGKLGSGGDFDAVDPGSAGIRFPDASKPVVFTLYKQGAMEPLVKVRKNYLMAHDGAPVPVQLDPGVPNSSHQVILKCWSKDQEPRPAGEWRYDWRLEISVPEGALKLRDDDYAFEAPMDGYQASDSIAMEAAQTQPAWKDRARRSYFIRFSDGVFARVDVEMLTGGKHYAKWASHLNPRPKSRNLEAAP